MEIMKHPNMADFTCPICKTNDYKPIIMIPIAGTEDGNKHQFKQVHIDCIDLTIVTMTVGKDDLWLVQKL